MATTIDTTSQTDEMLKQTGIGHFIAKNKTAVIAGIALIILGVIGYGVFSSQKAKKEEAYQKAIYEFEKTHFASLKDKKLEIVPYLEKFEAIKKDVNNFKGLFPLVIKTGDYLLENKKYTEGITLFKEFKRHVDNNAMKYLLDVRLAVFLEDSGNLRGAVEVYEGMIKSNQKLLEPKTYFELGRLHLALGEKEKAKTNLQYAIDNSTDENLKKLAKFYLSEV